ncbi:predicted protein [Naegleria gruberi]|uniref:Predicted protein n=1 Tax=Naegleria gruberi TaxID=5762 RepID=D2VB89_NAEGR|nr:uncharacterized protein NAEGRDRAFT_48138 [Naegleria gruberi]EFC45867.1 predicted protein [Naegleria gruberi]|eukprot:XP_002678611.1 predicted protein [Naegleria gruberi strain NEG-M]
MKKFLSSHSVFNKIVSSSCCFHHNTTPSLSAYAAINNFLNSTTTSNKSFHTNTVFSNAQVSLNALSSSNIEEIMKNLPDPSTLNIKPRNKKEPVVRNKTRQTWRDRPKVTPKFLDTLPTVTFRQINIKQGPKKVNEVTELLRGISAKEALIQLQSCDKKIAPIIYRFIRSCMLNAENIHGMNADRLLIRECIVNKQKYGKALRFHAKGRFGLELNRKTSVLVKMVEVPEIEGEHRLGRYGWTNKTWREYEEDMLREKTTETVEAEEVFEPQQEMSETEEVIAEPVEEVKAETPKQQ